MIKIFSFGVDGGGADVYLLPDGSVLEKGGGGGILPDDDDQVREWGHLFPNWESWWSDFQNKFGDFWINFAALYVDPLVSLQILEAVAVYPAIEDSRLRRRDWLGRIAQSMNVANNPYPEFSGESVQWITNRRQTIVRLALQE